MIEWRDITELYVLMNSYSESVEGDCYEDNNKNNSRVKNDLFRSASRLIKPDTLAAQKPGHAGRTLLKKNERDDGDGKYDLDYGDHD